MAAAPIVTFSSIDWDYVWQGHQEVMTRLAEAGHPILFVENTGLRRPRLSDWSRIRRRAATLASSASRHTPSVSGLEILAPRILPFPYSSPAVALNRRLLEPPIRQWLARYNTPPIVWTYLPTPLVHALVSRMSPALLIYCCVDDLPASSDLARAIIPSENEMFRVADLVFVTSERLREKALGHRSTVHLFPSGVAFERFDAARTHPPPPSPEVRSLARPIVGYVGGLHRWFDVSLMHQVASSLSDVQFLIVGPATVPVELLASLKNVHLTGARPHEDIPAYLAHVDAAIIPYILDEYTASVFPTKLLEYLAMGLPVVSTSVPEVLAFRNRHGDVVDIADTPDAFAAAIRRALVPQSPGAREARSRLASSQSWAVRVAGMLEQIRIALAPKEQHQHGRPGLV
jgi:glycosyltransferase involved in cell wall biosynthesis